MRYFFFFIIYLIPIGATTKGTVLTGGHAVVPRAGGATWLAPLLHRYRHVVRRVHLCGDGHARHPTLPRRFGN